MPLGINISFREARSSRKYPFTSFMLDEAKSKTQRTSFKMDFKKMKEEYAAFMDEHLSKMDNFYPDWDVNAVKGLLQTGRFSKYADDILDELLHGIGVKGDFDVDLVVFPSFCTCDMSFIAGSSRNGGTLRFVAFCSGSELRLVSLLGISR